MNDDFFEKLSYTLFFVGIIQLTVTLFGIFIHDGPWVKISTLIGCGWIIVCFVILIIRMLVAMWRE